MDAKVEGVKIEEAVKGKIVMSVAAGEVVGELVGEVVR